MIFVIGILILGAVIYLPNYWVKHAIKKHSVWRDDFPGTGGELAEHFVKEFELNGVKVEETKEGDHYSPDENTVRLLKDNFDGKSISAIAIAAHEIGHAIQHHQGNKLLKLRQSLAKFAQLSDMIASIFFFAAPVIGVLAKTPIALFGFIAIGVSLLGVRILVHLITLPVEWDASFNKALPILEQGGYLKLEDMPAARQVLKAAALTYVAGAMVSLLDLARWIRIIR